MNGGDNMTIQTLRQHIKNGGCTVDKNGDTVQRSNGYQCSVNDVAILSAVDYNGILKTVNKLLKTIKTGEYVGLWVDGGKCYIDISICIRKYKTALTVGKKLKQLAIFDWNKKQCITL